MGFKKILALFFALIIIICMFSACSKNENDEVEKSKEKVDVDLGDLTDNESVNKDPAEDEIPITEIPNKDSVEKVKITVNEGSTCEDIIEVLVSNGLGTRDKYIDVINNYDFSDFWFVNDIPYNTDRYYRLEGYLSPGVYEFAKNTHENDVIREMLTQFDNNFPNEYCDKIQELGYTVDQIIILASIVQVESDSPYSYNYVSSVLHNRLKSDKIFPKLECDATILYALQVISEENDEPLNKPDLLFDNPYNSYLNNGLPPSAISNPCVDAIYSAIYPAETNYYYYVKDANGYLYFSRTLQEHEKTIEKLLNKTQ